MPGSRRGHGSEIEPIVVTFGNVIVETFNGENGKSMRGIQPEWVRHKVVRAARSVGVCQRRGYHQARRDVVIRSRGTMTGGIIDQALRKWSVGQR